MPNVITTVHRVGDVVWIDEQCDQGAADTSEIIFSMELYRAGKVKEDTIEFNLKMYFEHRKCCPICRRKGM